MNLYAVARTSNNVRAFRFALLLFISSNLGVFAATNYVVVGWNNLGMHCMDSDYSVFSILPPYNTIQAQVIQIINNNTVLMTTTNGFRLTYEAVADPDGSFNSTAAGKGDFWENCPSIFGASLPVDVGLPVPGPDPFSMPGTNNVPQRMGWESPMNWFIAYGIPIAPYDDTGKPNQYPLMRLRLRNDAGTTLATTDIVLPVSDEMDCKLCHLSGSGPAAKPAAGWVNDTNPGRDYRLNILRLHDERQWANNATLYAAALASNALHTAGLYASVTISNHPFICASCHVSEALPIPPLLGIKPLTAAVHSHHAGVIDPRNNQTLDAANNRVGCYSCHPGSATRCLRGAMGKAVAADGSMAMQCQSCHGNMSAVGSLARTGWFDEPNCQACHVGTATNSYGVIRYLDALVGGSNRPPAERTFATNLDTPLPNLSLYRFSKGHGGLQCSACHGSTHAEFPSAFANDNIQNQTLQNHAGVLIECEKCHGTQPANSQFRNGPHRMHPISSSWWGNHADYARQSPGVSQCKACHGATYQGTVLARSQTNRAVSTKFGSRNYWRGYQISCYNCHDGVNSSNPTTKGFPTANNVAASTVAGQQVGTALTGSGATSWRIVSQPANGTVALSGTSATYFPGLGYSGTDTFTFAASNGYNDSNLATGTVSVALVFSTNDGIPDWWRALHFPSIDPTGTTTNAQSCALCDPDNDQFSNAQELVAQTDPLDARYAPRIFGFTLAGGTARVDIVSALGQKFAVDRRDDLIAGMWTSLTTNLWGKTDTTSFTDPGAASQPNRFYRVRSLP